MSVLFSFFSGLSQCHLFAESSAVKTFFFAAKKWGEGCLFFQYLKMFFANHDAGFTVRDSYLQEGECKLSMYQLMDAMRKIWGEGGDN
jgi:hypothetical protein